MARTFQINLKLYMQWKQIKGIVQNAMETFACKTMCPQWNTFTLLRFFVFFFFLLWNLKDKRELIHCCERYKVHFKNSPLLNVCISSLPGVLHLSLSIFLENPAEDLRALSTIFSSSYLAAWLLQYSHAWTKSSSFCSSCFTGFTLLNIQASIHFSCTSPQTCVI